MITKFKDKHKAGESSFRGRGHNPYINTNVEIPIENYVPINSISAGHVVFGKPAGSAQKEREQLGRPKGLK